MVCILFGEDAAKRWLTLRGANRGGVDGSECPETIGVDVVESYALGCLNNGVGRHDGLFSKISTGVSLGYGLMDLQIGLFVIGNR